MRFLQKIKLLVAHCATGGGGGGGGGGKCSTLIRRRRRRRKKPHEFSKFRRMLHGADRMVGADERRNSEELKQRLVDLFFESEGGGGGDEGGCGGGAERTRAEEGMARGGRRGWRFGSSVGLRCRLLRRAWRPVLVAIPEND
ncbi:snake venom metalloprotease inhibitor 02D01-like [Zingiber officinale]|uniref:snake venom metalloprotease inhibitor 02D01-like n=1 Tax=Zingiber officinale TaxID=94328 RepID=UPI001C4B8E25|nr:snake venom metalloprotease inhibitor 02D01-like [Zingiber officinale]